jgi:hypothetical protein
MGDSLQAGADVPSGVEPSAPFVNGGTTDLGVTPGARANTGYFTAAELGGGAAPFGAEALPFGAEGLPFGAEAAPQLQGSNLLPSAAQAWPPLQPAGPTQA